MFVSWLYIDWGNNKSCKLYCVGAKHKLLWVLYDSMVTTDVQPTTCLEEAFLEGVGPQARVVNDFGLIWKITNDFVKSPSISILGGQVALWAGFVPISPPWRNERCEVAIFLPNWDTVVSVPCVSDCFLGSGWH